MCVCRATRALFVVRVSSQWPCACMCVFKVSAGGLDDRINGGVSYCLLQVRRHAVLAFFCTTMAETAKALASLRGVHLRTLEQLKNAAYEVDELKKMLGSRGNVVDEREIERIKGEMETNFNRELKSMRTQLEAANAEKTDLAKWKKDAEQKLSQLETSQRSTDEAAMARIKELEGKLTSMGLAHANELKELGGQLQASLLESKALSDQMTVVKANEVKAIQENERLGAVIENLNKELRKLQLSMGKDKKDVSKRTKELEAALKASKERTEQLERENITLKNDNDAKTLQLDEAGTKVAKLEEGKAAVQKALDRARLMLDECKSQWTDENNKKIFLEKSLAAAKSEWERLVHENTRLTEELENLKATMNSGNSKFAQFVELKEENSNLARKHNKLQKQHTVLKKEAKRKGVSLRAKPPPSVNRKILSEGPRPPQVSSNQFPRDGSR